jgi:type I restriction enzyme, S subunit
MICEGGEPGRCAIWRDETSEMYFQKALHRVRALGGVSPEYLALCLESDANSSRLERYFTGATIKHFAGQELSRYCVPLPPISEQVRIVARVGELRLLCAALRERLTARQNCQVRFAEALAEQAASTAPLVGNAGDLAAAA